MGKSSGKNLTVAQKKTLRANGIPHPEFYLYQKTVVLSSDGRRNLKPSDEKIEHWQLIHKETGETISVKIER